MILSSALTLLFALTAASPSGQTLDTLLDNPAVTIQQVEQHLASLSGAERVLQATHLKRAQQEKLWNLAEHTAPVRETDLVPANAKPFDPVPFEGQNNQLIYRDFKKVFYRTSDGMTAGNNVSDAAWFAGHGYYVVATGPTGAYVNYFEVPKEKPQGWPEIKENSKGLSQFVYGNMKDYLRRVYGLVLIGRAYKNGKETGNYFVLARP